jgi:hypothetical protein
VGYTPTPGPFFCPLKAIGGKRPRRGDPSALDRAIRPARGRLDAHCKTKALPFAATTNVHDQQGAEIERFAQVRFYPGSPNGFNAA